jgi:hypothetical protein
MCYEVQSAHVLSIAFSHAYKTRRQIDPTVLFTNRSHRLAEEVEIDPRFPKLLGNSMTSSMAVPVYAISAPCCGIPPI